MKKILVTGASGYIGSTLVKRFSSDGRDVIATSRRHSQQICDELGVQVEMLDVLNGNSSLTHREVDCLVHCASANDIYSKDFSSGMKLSITGTWNILEIARNLNVKQIIFLSTLQVYGTELTGVVSEDSSPNCETPYALNHWFAEEVCRLFHKKTKIPVSIVRLANGYGAPVVSSVDRRTLVPTCFVEDAFSKGALTLRSSGKQQRNFVSTNEVGNAFSHLLDHMHGGFQIFNVCSTLLLSIGKVAELTAGIYQEIYGARLPISILSDEPRETNEFQLKSKLSFLWPTPEQAAESLKREIRTLFQQRASHGC